MTIIEAIKAVMNYEFERGQALYEMVTDGYNGDINAYADDYVADYEAEETEDGIVVKLDHTGERWLVTETLVTRDSDIHVYEVLNEADETVLKTTDKAKAHNMTLEDDTLVYLEDGKVVSW